MLFVANVGSMLCTFALLAYFSRTMSESFYGEFRQMLLVIVFANAVLPLGYPLTLLQHTSITPSRNQALTSVFIIQIGICLVWLAVALPLNGYLAGSVFNISDPAVMHWVVLTVLVNILATIIYPAFILAGAYFSAGVYTVCSLLIPSVGIATAYIVHPDLETMFFVYFVSSVITFVVFFGWAIWRTKSQPERPDPGILRSIFGFGLRLGSSSIFGTGQRYLDKFYVATICSSATFAVYANGSQEPPLVGALQRSINSVLIPEMAKLLTEGQASRARKIWSGAVIKSHAILFPGALFLAVNAALTIITIFGENYRESQYIFLLFTILIPLRAISFGAVLIAAGNVQTVFRTSLAGFFATLVFAPVGIFLFGYIGAAAAHVLITLLIIIPWLTKAIMKVYKCDLSNLLPWNKISQVCLLSLIAVGTSMLWPGDLLRLPALNLAARLAIAGLILLPLYWRLGYLKDMNFSMQSKKDVHS